MPDTEAGSAAAVELIAVVAAATADEPRVLTVDGGRLLPSGPFESAEFSLQAGLRSWVERQTRHALGYVEQLYTFADKSRVDAAGRRIVSIGYLGLTREARGGATPGAGWRSWYAYFPWEDRRDAAAEPAFVPALRAWAEAGDDYVMRRDRARRAAVDFGLDGQTWNENLTLQRYELLWEAGLVVESGGAAPGTGQPMAHDHRRIMATGIARLRAKIEYRPVVFELIPPIFTLLRLQRTVEAIAGRRLHKQNFRRLIEQQDLVEETGETAREAQGRPAKLFRFRPAVLAERAVAGTKLPLV